MWISVLAASALAGVAAAGVLRPFGTAQHVRLERLSDPLEDERQSLLRTLKELEEERASGTLDEENYRVLRGETETRAVAVLRALEARDRSGELPADLRELRTPSPGAGGNGSGSAQLPARQRRWPLTALVGAAVVIMILPLLVSAVTNRSSDQPITGSAQGGQAPGSAISFFEQRVRDHPQDLAARLDLAQRYLVAGEVGNAVGQYLEALRIDPGNAEAHANLGYVLYLGGKASEGLDQVDQALANAPRYPEALYFKGVILLNGLHRPGPAAAALHEYLTTAPYGSHVAEVRRLLQLSRRG